MDHSGEAQKTNINRVNDNFPPLPLASDSCDGVTQSNTYSAPSSPRAASCGNAPPVADSSSAVQNRRPALIADVLQRSDTSATTTNPQMQQDDLTNCMLPGAVKSGNFDASAPKVIEEATAIKEKLDRYNTDIIDLNGQIANQKNSKYSSKYFEEVSDSVHSTMLLLSDLMCEDTKSLMFWMQLNYLEFTCLPALKSKAEEYLRNRKNPSTFNGGERWKLINNINKFCTNALADCSGLRTLSKTYKVQFTD